MLIAHGALVTAPILWDASLLHLAKTKEMAQYLLKMGVDIKKRDSEGNTPLLSFLKNQIEEIEDKDPDVVQNEATAVAEVLIQAGVDLDVSDDDLMSAIDYASLAKMDKLVSMLKAKGAKLSDINEKMLHKELAAGLKSKSLEIYCNDPDYVRWDVDTKLVHDWIAKGTPE